MTEEYFDVLDEKGKKTGKTKLRTEVHRDGDWHQMAQAWIINSKKELLLQKRAGTKKSYPSKWDISCVGHVSAGDDTTTTIVRELKEELGLEIKEEALKLVHKYVKEDTELNGAYINRQHNDVYLIELDLALSQLTLNNDEVSEVRFIHYTDLDRHIKEKTLDLVFTPEECDYLFDLLKNRGLRKMAKIIIVNEKDEEIGLKERDKPGINGFRRISCLWLTNSNSKVLLAQRSFNKKLDPGKWGPAAAGTVEEGETYETNLVEEAEEEIGLKDFEYKKGPKLKIEDNVPRFAQYYFAEINKPIKDFKIQKEEVEKIKWISISQLEMDFQKHPENYTVTVSKILKKE